MVKEWNLAIKGPLSPKDLRSSVCPSDVTVVWEGQNIASICGYIHCVNFTKSFTSCDKAFSLSRDLVAPFENLSAEHKLRNNLPYAATQIVKPGCL